MDRQDLTVVRVLLISSNEVLSHVFAIVRMASRGPPFQTPPTISHGQPQTGRQDVPHPLIWSAIDYTTRHLSTVRKTAWVVSHKEQVHHDGQVPDTTPRTSSPRRHRRSPVPRRLRHSLSLLIPELNIFGCAESQCKQTVLNR